MLAWSWLSRKVGACARMGRVQGGARAAFATLSWGPARMTYFVTFEKRICGGKPVFFYIAVRLKND
jgi:hypothetical protein